MTSTQRNQLLAIAAILIICVAGTYLFFNQPAPASSPSESMPQPSATSTKPVATSTQQQPSHTVQAVSLPQAPVVPDYNAAVSFGASVSAEARAAIEVQAAKVRANLAKNNQDFNAWIALGNVYKSAGDYGGAAKVWQYASLTWPTNIVSFNNLGDLYMNFLHDYQKAEANYLTEAKNNPTVSEAYRDLFQIYTTAYAPTATAAEDILKKGIATVPKAVDLQVLLARFYKAAGRQSEAQVVYQSAIQNATSQGQAELAAQIQAEASAQ